MNLSPRRQQELRNLAWTIVLVAPIGGLIGFIIAYTSGGDLYWHGLVQGAFTATFISLCVGGLTIFYRNSPSGHWLRRLSFKQSLAFNSLVYLLVIMIGIRLGVSLFYRVNFLEFRWLATETLIALLLSAVIAIVINLGQQMDRMLGQGVLKKYLSGAYHKPREEERIFLFIDVIGSTGIAERIGAIKFHALLDRFFYDLTDPVLANKGEIHKYVGDEVIISWPVTQSGVKGNALKCFFDIKQEMERHKDLYEIQFGFVPSFRGAINAGPVVTGEIGDIKQEIVFLGDTVNTAARILSKASELKRELFMSQSAREILPIPKNLAAESLGVQVLRGRQQHIELFAVHEQS